MSRDSLIGVRDPFGIRPLVLGKLNGSYVFSSESCGLDIIGAELVRDVEPGEILIIKNNKTISIKPFNRTELRPCLFEYIYFLDQTVFLKEEMFMMLEKKLVNSWLVKIYLIKILLILLYQFQTRVMHQHWVF